MLRRRNVSKRTTKKWPLAFSSLKTPAMQKILLFLFFLSVTVAPNLSLAQSICAYEHAYSDTAVRSFRWAQRRLKNQQYATASVQSRTQAVYEVKVVVHVLYNNVTENLPDSLIYNQIAYLNRDFRATNPDSDKVRPVFADRIGDAAIEFKLEAIVRKPLDKQPVQDFAGLPLYDAMKVDSLGGSSPWDTKRYLNIWIFNVPSTIILGSASKVYGYATLPDSLPHYPAYLNNVELESLYISGVVIDVSTVSDGTPRFDAVTNRVSTGRVLTHEVGHYLGLLHSFDSPFSILFGDFCKLSDGLSDTPPQANSSRGCITANSCTTDFPDEPDMLENHMDYSDDICRVAFTQQQIAVMRNVLENERPGLITSVLSTSNASKNNQNIQVNPNPVTDRFMVQFDAEWNTIEWYNATGQLVKVFNPTDVLSVADLPSGWYGLCVKHQDGRLVGWGRVVKRFLSE